MEKNNLKIHFIGLGGIGVSALARFSLARGAKISGSDVCDSPILRDLKKLGAKIFIGHRSGNIPKDTELVIYTAAVQPQNLEFKEAKRRKIKCQTYAEALGDLTRQMWTIAVSGMHGKSTTTAMIGLMMEKAGLDPTVIVGTKLREWGNSNCRVGKSQFLVIEADEYNASFLNYWPKIIVLTNIEEEHLDYYKGGLPHIMKVFSEYVKHLNVKGGDTLIANATDKNVFKIVKKTKAKVVLYFYKEDSGLKLKIPGAHNLSNASAVLVVAKELSVTNKVALEAVNNFKGTWRRMEYRGLVNGAKIYDDYGHHPTEIKATLAGARELIKGEGKLWCIFQPHQYQRTYKLFKQFTTAFDGADKTILLPIYSVPGREKASIKKKVSSEKLVKALRQVLTPSSTRGAQGKPEKTIYLNSFPKAAKYLKKNLKKGDMAIIMGAGDINQLTDQLVK